MATPASQNTTGTSSGSQHASQQKQQAEQQDSKKERKSLSSNIRTKEDALKAFRVPPKYKVQDVLGQGAYGIVVSAVDADSKELVAVKKIERVFDHETFTKRTLREIRVLKLLKHENIIALKGVFATARAKDDFDDLYLVFELMETDLASIIKSPQPLTGHHVQFFVYQILRGLKFLHTAGIIHRDIKPRNLLVNSNCDLKICDMGLARFDTGKLTGAPAMTDYIATRWYRAPEIILQWDGYCKPIDMWSVGCILAELIGRKPIFPGNEADHQITLICDVLGRPGPSLVQRCPHPETIEFLEALPKKAAHPLHHVYRHADIVAIDLLTKLLKFDPDKRLTVNECLKHPYLQQLHCPDDEPESQPLDLVRDFPFDAVKHMPSAELAQIVVDEIESSGRFYLDQSALSTADKNRSRQHNGQQHQYSDPQPPTDSPPPMSPPPPTHPPMSQSFATAVAATKPSQANFTTLPTTTVSSSGRQFQRHPDQDVFHGSSSNRGDQGGPAAAGGCSSASSSTKPAKKPSTPQRTYVVSSQSVTTDDGLSPALVVHSPILESSHDSTIPPHTPKSPSTPSNVSIELGRLGAAIDELRAM